jgi:hypothetical protein
MDSRPQAFNSSFSSRHLKFIEGSVKVGMVLLMSTTHGETAILDLCIVYAACL